MVLLILRFLFNEFLSLFLFSGCLWQNLSCGKFDDSYSKRIKVCCLKLHAVKQVRWIQLKNLLILEVVTESAFLPVCCCFLWCLTHSTSIQTSPSAVRGDPTLRDSLMGTETNEDLEALGRSIIALQLN